ncbi:MAG: BolA family transcriptional regulator [Candidatus Melainabacteria bacterium HGW-Melainabacteria-1]|nr:MAG: BolA family transcriptional regulator [Candidatus Melainabacteria bacterium HGW-Melainabacteria-1]
MSAQLIKELIESTLENSQVYVKDFTGSGDHLEINVVWPGFEGMSRVKQHQKVYGIVTHLVGDGRPVHALSMKTWTQNPEALASPSDAYYG